MVFNTAMTGYQEIVTDPSYRGQIVVMTQPHMGNYGTRAAAAESGRPWVEGFVARQFTDRPSGVGSEESLPVYLRRHGVPALAGIDTRALVRRLRERGSLTGVITTERSDVAGAGRRAGRLPDHGGAGAGGRGDLRRALRAGARLSRRRYGRRPQRPQHLGRSTRCHLAVYDYGVKRNILRSLTARGARLTVLPARTPAAACLDLGVDGVVLSNGPGDPEPLAEIIGAVRELVERRVPLLGICLGHQLLGLALGGSTFKLKFGHHGANQPVRDVDSGRVAITSQNHGFAVRADSLPASCRVAEVNLNDGTVEAFAVAGRPVWAVQYHPEAAPGPHDASPLFDRFLAAVAPRASSPR